MKNLLTFLFFIIPIVVVGQSESDISEIERLTRFFAFSGINLILFISIIPFSIIIRDALRRKMRTLMMKKNDDAYIENKDYLEGTETLTKTELKFEVLDYSSAYKETEKHRKTVEKRARKRVRKKLWWEFIFAFIYVYIRGKTTKEYSIWTLRTPEGDMALDFLAEYGFYFILSTEILFWWAILRLIGNRWNFRAYFNDRLSSWKPIAKILLAPFDSKYYTMLTFIVVTSGLAFPFRYIHNPNDDNPFSSILLAIILTLLAHLFVRYLLKLNSRNYSNIKLTVLRVFGIETTSKFTFTRLMKYWENFGSYLTIVDPVLFEVNWKKEYNKNLPKYLIIMFAYFGLFQLHINILFFEHFLNNTSDMITYNTIISIPMITLPIIFYYYHLLKIKRSFIRNEKSLESLLKKKLKEKPVNWNSKYKGVPLMCFDNTWKMAVNNISKATDVILMDLRGYSQENKGCEYEVNFLFNFIDINKIVFLTENDSIKHIKTLLSKCWETILETSPNRIIDNPKAIIYTSFDYNKIGTKNIITDKDTQGIIDILQQTAIINNQTYTKIYGK